MPSTKVNLSTKEMQMVMSEEIIHTKIAVLQKVDCILNDCISRIDSILIQNLPESVKAQLVVPKISKGEQYLQMPYRILDCPRIFKGEDIFAVRTMFLWGNYFSVTLHVSGAFLDTCRSKLKVAQQKLPASFYVCIQNDQWQHDFSSSNYVALHSIDKWQDFVQQASFIKLAVKFHLHQWEQINDLLDETYLQTASLLH